MGSKENKNGDNNADFVCEMPRYFQRDEEIIRILKDTKVIAMVGLSPNPHRDAYSVASFLIEKGYRVIPVNPVYDEIFGEKSYPNVRDIPESVDMVNIFRKSSAVIGIVQDILEKTGVKYVWMQEGVINNEAADLAVADNLKVVMNKCILKEYKIHKIGK